MPRRLLILVAATLMLLPLGLRHALDLRNAEYLDALGPNRAHFEDLIAAIHKQTWCWVIITSGYRDRATQTRLHQENQKNARAGRSKHGVQRAIDINLVTWSGLIRKRDSTARWLATGVPQLAEKKGFRWGGRFHSYHDPVHFELPVLDHKRTH